MRRPMPTAERTMTPGASDQDDQRDDLTEEVRLENGSELARTFFTSAALVGAAMCSAFECGSHDRWP
jgi:hypothetical protein